MPRYSVAFNTEKLTSIKTFEVDTLSAAVTKALDDETWQKYGKLESMEITLWPTKQ